jgi:AbrB family looped-hinge helix DNA binding protein
MDVTIDDHGRIVIPKSIRDRFGLESGSSLTLEVADADEHEAAITLRPQGQELLLQQKGDLLVHTGRLTDEEFDVVEQLRNQREERARRHAGVSE